MNMRLALICFFCIAIVKTSSAQQDKILIKKDGSRIQCKRFSEKGGVFKIKKVDGSTEEVPSADIMGVCNPKTMELEYLTLPVDGIYMYRILEGEINVYRGCIPAGMANGHQQCYKISYAEKNGVFTTFKNGQEKGKTFLNSLISDAPQPIQIPDDFYFSDNEIIDILRNYNLQFFKPIPAEAYHDAGTLQFYNNTRSTKAVTLSVNDSLTYSFTPAQRYPLTVQIPFVTASKICVTSDNGKFCNMILPSECSVKCFEIRFNENRGYFEMTQKTKEDMQRYFLDLKRYDR